MGLRSRNSFGWRGFRDSSLSLAVCLVASFLCLSAASEPETISWEKLTPIEVDGTVLFRDILGEPFRANFVGGPAEDILWVERRRIESDEEDEGAGAEEQDEAEEGDEGGRGFELIFTLIDVETSTGLTARYEAGAYPWILRLLTVNGQPRLAVYHGIALRLFRVAADKLQFTLTMLPKDSQALDFGRIGPGPDLHAVALTKSKIFTSLVTDAPFEWREHEGTSTVYAPWIRLSDGSRLSSLHGGARFLRDLDGDGRDEILLPSERTLTVGVRDGAGAIHHQTLAIPDGGQRIDRHRGGDTATRQRSRIPALWKQIRLYDLILRPGMNPFHEGGMCLVLADAEAEASHYALRRTDEAFSLEAVAEPDIRLRGDVVPCVDSTEFAWAPVSYRLLRQRFVFDSESTQNSDHQAWLVDLNGDGRDEILRWRGALTTTGPTSEVRFTLAGTTEEKGLVAHCWAYIGDGGLADLNGDGALDLVTFRPALDIRRVLQGMHMKGKVDLVYTIWFFDKSRGGYHQRNTLDLKTRQVYDPTKGRPQIVSGDGEWSWWRVDYGDVNGDGLLDLAFLLSDTEIGIVFNDPKAKKPFDHRRMTRIEVPEYRGLLACDFRGAQALITWKGWEWRSDDQRTRTVIIPREVLR
ncbi:MAG: hypothetical protein GY851_03820 [bacterium]|nr:hypothetical protein [bacterium]